MSGTLEGRFWFVIGLKCIGQLQLHNLIIIFFMKFPIRLKKWGPVNTTYFKTWARRFFLLDRCFPVLTAPCPWTCLSINRPQILAGCLRATQPHFHRPLKYKENSRDEVPPALSNALFLSDDIIPALSSQQLPQPQVHTKHSTGLMNKWIGHSCCRK